MEVDMGTLMIKPDPNLKKVWYLCWLVVFVILAVGDYLLITLLVDPEARLILGIMASALIVVCLLVLLYLPAYFRSLEYHVEDEAVTGRKGVFWTKASTVPYAKITNIDITQGPLQRMYGIGNIHCQTAGFGGAQGSKAELVLMGIRDLEGIKNEISARFIKKQ